MTFQDRWYHTTAESGVRDEALRLLATCRTAEDERLVVVSDDVREASAPFVVKDLWDPPKDAIAEPGHLDQLWTTFFATGSFAAVERITTVLDLDAESSKKNAVLQGAARWSLNSIAEQNELAHAYLVGIVSHPKTPAAATRNSRRSWPTDVSVRRRRQGVGAPTRAWTEWQGPQRRDRGPRRAVR